MKGLLAVAGRRGRRSAGGAGGLAGAGAEAQSHGGERDDCEIFHFLISPPFFASGHARAMFVICGDKTTFFIRCVLFVARRGPGRILTSRWRRDRERVSIKWGSEP